MLTVTILLLLLHTLLVKPKPGVLCCGLFGGSFNEPIADKILWRIKTLGLFNQQRGSDSCGIYNGDVLLKGVDGNKKFTDFQVNVGVPENKGNNHIFIGHTRWSTMGANSAENAHPYNIDDKLIFAHNGKIENAWDLCRKYDIDPIKLNVDSQGLGHLLAKIGSQVFSLYKGYAAVLVHDLSKPNVLYAFHGASKEFKAGDLKEERPLFYMKTQEGIYFSSLKEGLSFIKDPQDDEPDTLPHNIVFTMKDGKFIKQSKYIDREEMNVCVYTPTVVTRPSTAPERTANTTNYYYNTSPTKKETTWKNVNQQGEDLYIGNETIPDEWGDDRIYYYRNRYFYNEEPCDGVMRFNSQGKQFKDGEPIAGKATTMYFYKGIYLKGEKEYRTVMKHLLNKDSDLSKTLDFDNRNFAKTMSKWARYPITNVGEESKSVESEHRNMFYVNEKVVNADSITPLFSKRLYTYKEGKLKSICVATGGTPKETFFLIPSAKNCGRGVDDTKAQGGTLSTQQVVDRCSLVSSVCSRLSLEKVTPEVDKTIALFYTTFSQIDDMKKAMKGIGDAVMNLYMMDIFKEICNIPEPKSHVVEEAIEDMYYQAIADGFTLKDLMQEGVELPEFYIGEILSDWDWDDKEDEEKSLADSLREMADADDPVPTEDWGEYPFVEGEEVKKNNPTVPPLGIKFLL